MRARWIYSVALLAAAACGSVSSNKDAGPPDDAPVDTPIDTPIDVPDRVDAGLAPPGAEFNASGGRMTGGTFSMDVQLGHPIGQQRITGPTLRLEGNAPIKR